MNEEAEICGRCGKPRSEACGDDFVPASTYLSAVNGRREFRNALREARALHRWLPIATAPKDRRIILAKVAATVGSVEFNIPPEPAYVWWAVLGQWSEKWQNWNDGIEPCGLASPNCWMEAPEPFIHNEAKS